MLPDHEKQNIINSYSKSELINSSKYTQGQMYDIDLNLQKDNQSISNSTRATQSNDSSENIEYNIQVEGKNKQAKNKSVFYKKSTRNDFSEEKKMEM